MLGPSWDHFETILRPFWDPRTAKKTNAKLFSCVSFFGALLRPHWDHLGIMSGPSLDHLGVILGPFGDQSGMPGGSKKLTRNNFPALVFWCPLKAILGLSCGMLGNSLGLLGARGAISRLPRDLTKERAPRRFGGMRVALASCYF